MTTGALVGAIHVFGDAGVETPVWMEPKLCMRRGMRRMGKGNTTHILTIPKFATPQSTTIPPLAFGPFPVPTGKGERLTGPSNT